MAGGRDERAPFPLCHAPRSPLLSLVAFLFNCLHHIEECLQETKPRVGVDGRRWSTGGERGQRNATRRKKTAIDLLRLLTAVRRPPPAEPPEPLGQAPVPGLRAYGVVVPSAASANARRLAGRGVAAEEAGGRAGGAQAPQQARRLL